MQTTVELHWLIRDQDNKSLWHDRHAEVVLTDWRRDREIEHQGRAFLHVSTRPDDVWVYRCPDRVFFPSDLEA